MRNSEAGDAGAMPAEGKGKQGGKLLAVVRESLVSAVLAAGLAVLVSPSDVALGVPWPHPAWVAALLMAARYGSHGLFIAAPIAWGLVAIAALLSSHPLHRVTDRLTSGADVVTLVASVLVAWIASAQEQRRAALSCELTATRARADAEHAAAKQLRSAVIALRGRADRIETSLTFLRQVASRLDGDDPVQAARAAVELIMARLGPRAAVVQARDDARLITIAWSGAWSAESPVPGDLSSDHTVSAAMTRQRPVRAVDLADANAADSDVAAPIVDGAGAVLGVVAMRGSPQSGVSVAMVHDLSTIAAWCSGAMVRAALNAGSRPHLAVLPVEPPDGEPPLPAAVAVSGVLETPSSSNSGEPPGPGDRGDGGVSAAPCGASVEAPAAAPRRSRTSDAPAIQSMRL